MKKLEITLWVIVFTMLIASIVVVVLMLTELYYKILLVCMTAPFLAIMALILVQVNKIIKEGEI
jgi:hypothetical protein